MLRSVLDMTESELDDAVRDLETALVFEPTGTDSWRFRHELLREVAYELPPPSVRRILHSRVADALVGDSDHPDWHSGRRALRTRGTLRRGRERAPPSGRTTPGAEARSTKPARASPAPSHRSNVRHPARRGTDARSGSAFGVGSWRRRRKEPPAHRPRWTSNVA